MADPPSLPLARGHWALPVLKLIIWPLLLLLGPLIYRGASRVPRRGGLIILANHLSDCDPVIIQACCPRPIQFMAKHELFSMKFIGSLMKWWGAFPIRRGKPDRGALKVASDLAKGGRAVCIFPEGQLSEDGKLQELKPGTALVIRMAGVPVICCGLKNTNRIVPYGSLIPRPAFSSVGVRWGELKAFEEHASGEEILEWVETQLRILTGEPKAG